MWERLVVILPSFIQLSVEYTFETEDVNTNQGLARIDLLFLSYKILRILKDSLDYQEISQTLFMKSREYRERLFSSQK